MDFTVEEQTPSLQQVMVPKIHEDVEVIEEQDDTHAIAAFYSQTGEEDIGRLENISFDPKLGLAVENLVNGLTLEQLWRVV